MESKAFIVARDSGECCSCGCGFCSDRYSSSGTWFRSVKRKYDEFENGGKIFVPGMDYTDVVKVEVENEIAVLREMVSNQQETIRELSADLEEERNASSSAANEAMSMILRLQREKADVQMEARQFKRFAEEKMSHDQEELAAFEELLYKREQIIESLRCEVQAYKHRVMSYGLTEEEADGGQCLSRNLSMADNFDDQFDNEYPPLKCYQNENHDPLEVGSDTSDIDKYAFSETSHGQLKSLEYKICQMERNSNICDMDGDSPAAKNILDRVVVGQSPQNERHARKFSVDSAISIPCMSGDFGSESSRDSPTANTNVKKMDYIPQTNHKKPGFLNKHSQLGGDGVDRVCSIDSVHSRAPGIEAGENYMKTSRGSLSRVDSGDPDIQKLYMRLQALESDRESMRQAIISMRSDRAQLILLKEIAQRVCTDTSPERRVTVKKPSPIRAFSFVAVFKWILSFIFWRKKARRTKYLFGLSPASVGLLMLMDKRPLSKPWRCVISSQLGKK